MVGADEHRRVVGVDHGLALVDVLLAHAVAAADGAPVVGAAQPAVGGAELEAGDLRWRFATIPPIRSRHLAVTGKPDIGVSRRDDRSRKPVS